VAEILGKKQALEPQWKKVYTARAKKRGTSELLRKIDIGLKPKDYDRAAFVKNVTGNNAKGDAQRFVKGFGDAIASLKKKQAEYKDWTEKEKSFFAKLINELEFEQQFWLHRAK
jgi:hypothetical protein